MFKMLYTGTRGIVVKQAETQLLPPELRAAKFMGFTESLL